MPQNGSSLSASAVFPADERAALDVLLLVRKYSPKAGFAADRLHEIDIAVTEAVNNIIEHAYAKAPGGMVKLDLRVMPGMLTIDLADWGVALPGREIPNIRPANLTRSRSNLPEGGFGWRLIRQLCNEVRYCRERGKNQLTLSFGAVAAEES